MAKLGWAIAAMLAAVLVVGAAYSTQGGDGQKLDEIKALLAESNRLKRIDMHLRFFGGHKLTDKCDFDRICSSEEFASRTRSIEQERASLKPIDPRAEKHIGYFFHPLADDCDFGVKCKEREEDGQRKKYGLKK